MAGGEPRLRESDADIKQLESARASDLRRLWQERLGTPAPPTLSARLMRLAVAWQMQSEGATGEASADVRNWQTVMRRRAEGTGALEASRGLSAPVAGSGTRLLKSWGGEVQEVIVVEREVIWNGHSYTSLSAVARAMTGTPRNGPKFFGLREEGR